MMIPSSLINRQRTILLVLAVLIVLTIAIGMGIGYASLSFNRLLPTLFGQGTFKENFVLFSIRLPRMLITFLAGIALALSGAILQGVTRNDLADPGTIGINSGAGVAISVFYLFYPIEEGSSAYLLPLVSFIGAFMTVGLIYLLSYSKTRGLLPIRVILTGVGVSLALSGVMIVVISSAERMKVEFIAKWLAGNIWSSNWTFLWAILPWLVVLIPYTLYKANILNILGLHESAAISLGVSVKRERIVLLLAAVALAASVVSVTGGIAFVGLLSPHISKELVGPRNQLFLPVTILMGGWLLLFADFVGRNIFEPGGLPAGIMVALIGAPYFMYILFKNSP